MCQLCKNSYGCKSELERHIKSSTKHKKQRANMCKHCGLYFDKIEDIEIHVKDKHAKKLSEGMMNKSGMNKCDLCDKVFQNFSTLKSHKKIIHEGERRAECEQCGKTFTRLKGLRDHIRVIHDGIKEFECDQCGKGFGILKNLTVHIRTVHEGARDYVCSDCGKTFGHTSTLKDHFDRFHGGKPVKQRKIVECKICNKTVQGSSNLSRHMKNVHHQKS